MENNQDTLAESANPAINVPNTSPTDSIPTHALPQPTTVPQNAFISQGSATVQPTPTNSSTLSLAHFARGPIGTLFSLTTQQLCNLLGQGPPSFHSVPSDTLDSLREKAANLHVHLSPTNARYRGESQWHRLLGLSSHAIISEAYANPSRFYSALCDVLHFKSNLSPSLSDDQSPARLAGTAVDWVSNALYSNRQSGALTSSPPVRTFGRTSSRRAVMPSLSEPNKFDAFTFKENDFPPLPERFTDVAHIMDSLKEITWRQFPTQDLRVEESHGPGMLQNFLYGVKSVTQHVRSINFYRRNDVSWPGSVEYEAFSLARSLDLRLSSYPTAYHLFCIDPSVEVDIRRLYAYHPSRESLCCRQS